MGQLCDFCGDQRSMVYCQSDNVCLCFSCDRNVHSANTISRRHSRTLICERCNSQPAIVRCVQEKICFCQNCYWIHGYEAGPASSGHKRRQEEAISCYSGCPTAAELSNIWSFDLEFPLGLEDDDTALSCEQQGSGGLMGSTNEESRVNRHIELSLTHTTVFSNILQVRGEEHQFHARLYSVTLLDLGSNLYLPLVHQATPPLNCNLRLYPFNPRFLKSLRSFHFQTRQASESIKTLFSTPHALYRLPKFPQEQSPSQLQKSSLSTEHSLSKPKKLKSLDCQILRIFNFPQLYASCSSITRAPTKSLAVALFG